MVSLPKFFSIGGSYTTSQLIGASLYGGQPKLSKRSSERKSKRRSTRRLERKSKRRSTRRLERKSKRRSTRRTDRKSKRKY